MINHVVEVIRKTLPKIEVTKLYSSRRIPLGNTANGGSEAIDGSHEAMTQFNGVENEYRQKKQCCQEERTLSPPQLLSMCCEGLEGVAQHLQYKSNK